MSSKRNSCTPELRQKGGDPNHANAPDHSAPLGRFFSDAELAVSLGITARALQAWRSRGGGPKFVRVGRLVRYRQSDVESWLADQARANTSDEGGADA